MTLIIIIIINYFLIGNSAQIPKQINGIAPRNKRYGIVFGKVSLRYFGYAPEY